MKHLVKISAISALLLFAASNGWAEDQNGSFSKDKFMEGLAEVDILNETNPKNHALALGVTNSMLVWGWCDSKETVDKAKSCALLECPAASCRIFSANDEPYPNVLLDFGKKLRWNIPLLYKSQEDSYDRYKEEYYKSKQSSHWSDGLAEGAVKGLVQGLFLILIVSGIFKFAKKRKNSKKKQSD